MKFLESGKIFYRVTFKKSLSSTFLNLFHSMQGYTANTGYEVKKKRKKRRKKKIWVNDKELRCLFTLLLKRFRFYARLIDCR